MKNVNEKMYALGNQLSDIRELFDFGLKLKEKYGAENVYDYSLGNPSIPVPILVKDDIPNLMNDFTDVALFGYTSSNGDKNVRKTIADYMKKTYKADVDPEYIYMVCGGAASLAIVIKALYEKEDDELVVISPYFPEYKTFAKDVGMNLVEIEPDYQTFSINFEDLEKKITKNTKAIIINTPNNPTGVVYTEEDLKKISTVLLNKEKEYGTSIYLISDEPYRELIYNGTEPLYIPHFYHNTIVLYSYSKSLSLAGGRIGYILLPENIDSKKELYAAIKGAGRCLGYVCAPTFMQRLVARHQGEVADISLYKKNRDLLYNSLVDMGYEPVFPAGAFYLFVKTLEGDARAFSETATQFNLLLVPSDSFNCKSYVRLAYCVSYDMIQRSLPAFKKLKEFYDNKK